ncbi:PspC domain-containing protein [Paenibacillus sp. 1P07SE]|uniref:PspC domain-containing protein n=1 Tax=Paenibacillus sp. 1P07SE TaxID=3132209 RepID=UPI0039A43C98
MKKLYRSTRDRKLLGLCGGVAEMLNIDATLLRVLFIVAVIFSSGAMILVYILAGLVVPKEPPVYTGFGGGFENRYNNPYGPGGQGYYNSGPSHSDPYGRPGPADWQSQQRQQPQGDERYGRKSSDLDEMMDDIEKKALRKELDELKAKLSRYEKGDR